MASVVIYTKPSCPYCVAAKNLLTQRGYEYSEMRIDLDADLREEMLARSAGRRTVPQIFIDEKHIGGFDDLQAADRAGQLKDLSKVDDGAA